MLTNRFVSDFQPALLALADGSVFHGVAIGASGQSVGEVVFNTAMTGYQEILSDPSYAEQIVTLTYPHIGNVGVNRYDQESAGIWLKGLVIRDLSAIVSNWRSQQSLVEYLIQHNIVAIADIDTRRLTRLLRDQGATAGCILTGKVEPDIAIEAAKAYPGLVGQDLAKVVTCEKQVVWDEGVHALLDDVVPNQQPRHHVVVYDFGVKSQILRLLSSYGCRITIVPATTTADEVLALKPDGILLSNGPGDPAACDYAIKAIQALIETDVPLFGICLGFQLLALACGAKTMKMKFGHHGANHPVQDLTTKVVMITSQNHGFCVDDSSLPDDLVITHRSLFDGTLQGFKHQHKAIMGLQGHPEASPGPHDIVSLFADFVELMGDSAKASV